MFYCLYIDSGGKKKFDFRSERRGFFYIFSPINYWRWKCSSCAPAERTVSNCHLHTWKPNLLRKNWLKATPVIITFFFSFFVFLWEIPRPPSPPDHFAFFFELSFPTFLVWYIYPWFIGMSTCGLRLGRLREKEILVLGCDLCPTPPPSCLARFPFCRTFQLL